MFFGGKTREPESWAGNWKEVRLLNILHRFVLQGIIPLDSWFDCATVKPKHNQKIGSRTLLKFHYTWIAQYLKIVAINTHFVRINRKPKVSSMVKKKKRYKKFIKSSVIKYIEAMNACLASARVFFHQPGHKCSTLLILNIIV